MQPCFDVALCAADPVGVCVCAVKMAHKGAPSFQNKSMAKQTVFYTSAQIGG